MPFFFSRTNTDVDFDDQTQKGIGEDRGQAGRSSNEAIRRGNWVPSQDSAWDPKWKFSDRKGVGVMQIYDVPQLSEMLKVSKKAVRSYLITGRLKGRKVGKRWLIHEDAVREFLMNTEPIVTEQ